MSKVDITSNCIVKSKRLSLRYFEHVNTQFRSLLSQDILSSQDMIENQQISFAMCTVLMLRVRQNERKKCFGRSAPYPEYYAWQICLAAFALLLIHGWASVELPRNRVNVNLFLRHIRDLWHFHGKVKQR